MANIFYHKSILLEAVMYYTLCTVQVYILPEWKPPLPRLSVVSIWRGCSEARCGCCCSRLYAFCSVLVLCGKLVFKKQNKKNNKNHNYCLQTEKKITAFYTTEILSQDFAKEELGSSYLFAVDGESSVVSPHNGECANPGVLPSILYIFIILIVQNCIIFCNHHVQSVYVFQLFQ